MGYMKRSRKKVNLGLMAMESRRMFDGAAGADIVHDATVAKLVMPVQVEVRATDLASNEGRKWVVFVDTSRNAAIRFS